VLGIALWMVVAPGAAAQESSDMIQIGGEAEAAVQVAGPDLGTVIAVQIFGKKGDRHEGLEVRYFWVKGQLAYVDGDESSLPYVDVKIIPFSTLSEEEQGRLKQSMEMRLLPFSIRRDVWLSVDKAMEISLAGITIGGELKL